MQATQITTFQALRHSFKLLIQAAPREISYSIALNIIRGAAPSAVLFLDKLIIDEVSHLLSQTQTAQPLDLMLSQPVLLWSIVGVLSFKLLDDALDTIGDILTSSQRDRVQGFVQEKVLEKVANFDDIALFENPELLNIVQLAKSGVFRVQQLAFSISMTITGIFTFLPSTGLAVAIAWWVPLAILVSSLPSIYTQRKYIEIIWGVQKKQAKTHREMDLSFQVLTGENYAKELRLFGLQELWLDRWSNQFRQFFIEMQRVRKEAAIITLLWSAFSRIGVALPFVYVVVGALERRYTLGDLALYSGLIVQVERSLHILVYSFNNLYEIALGVTPIFQLLELESNLKSTAAGTASTPPELEDSKQDLSLIKDKIGIQIKDLSFCYPGSDKSTVENLNLIINPGEMLVVVGENGAGKTTLGKLLGRLYDPTSGAIEWNGQDLRNYSLEEVRSRIAVVMQDYARFPTTVKENVGFGNLLSLSDDVAINAAISEAGIAAKVNSLEKGLDTPLGKQLEDGIDLSGGQWQRMAIARALMRLSSVEMLIFDEPTAALDPKTEHEIYNIFRQIAVGKTTIVISHRLGLAKIADRIAVMENGKIVEIGNHDELIAANGVYCTMFTRQASSYV
ncbi:MAG: ABC transporter ATP-binding protein [Richelia sp. CSU_2_1]|nr:ABC transporter ATP-binding protein [Microcoleus sp. SU_5_6]NJR22352.1 ABC transporter ATP-binding protein [Richelia sp. CSU_2_1]